MRSRPAGKPARGYQRFLELSDRLDDISHRYFFWRSIGGLKDMFDPSTAVSPATLGDVMRMRPWSTVGATIRSFVAEKRVAQMLDHFTQYVGSSPDLSPAVLCGIAHMQTGEGVWYPRGGTRAVAEALIRLARNLGVELRTERRHPSIQLDGSGGVAGVITRRWSSSPTCGRRLQLPTRCGRIANCSATTPRRVGSSADGSTSRRARGSSSTWDSTVATSNCCTTISFSPAIPTRNSTGSIARGEPAPDPTCYVCAPAGTEPEVAPRGGEALYVLVHTPYLRPHHDWNALFPSYRRTILDKLAPDGRARRHRKPHPGRTLADSPRHPRPISRPGRRDLRTGQPRAVQRGVQAGQSESGHRGLYLAGGAAHPGPGMPMVLMSGWIAADTLDRDRVVTPVRDYATIPIS